MKIRLAAVSIAANVALLAVVLWVRADRDGELHDLQRAAMRADEISIQLLDRATNVVAAHGEDTRGALKRIGAGRR